MRRRDFISLLGGAAVAWPLAAAAQQRTNSKRLAIFAPAEPSADLHEHSKSKLWRAFFAELRRLGRIEGQNLKGKLRPRAKRIRPRSPGGGNRSENPDVIWVVGPGAVIFKKLTSRMPIVVITTDPVKQGLAESLARPGGNFTGASIDAGLSIHGKRIALLREMVPTMSKLGRSLFDGQWNGSSADAFRAAAEAAGLPLAVSLLEFSTSEADIRQRSRASPATVQMRSWSWIRLRSFKAAL